jgi:hypothetical protein
VWIRPVLTGLLAVRRPGGVRGQAAAWNLSAGLVSLACFVVVPGSGLWPGHAEPGDRGLQVFTADTTGAGGCLAIWLGLPAWSDQAFGELALAVLQQAGPVAGVPRVEGCGSR